MGRTLLSLSLFSGIGGLDLALKGVTRPLVYCEIHPSAIAVVEHQIRKGTLHDAAFNNDVRTLNRSWIAKNVKKSKPEAIVAGWPCPGHSGAGKKESFKHEESGLFREILRILDELHTVKYLFLENVANVLNNGMELIVSELHKKRGFDLKWVTVEAREVGAPQLRRRWFCIAYKAKLPRPPAFTSGYRSFASKWQVDPESRTVCSKGAELDKKDARAARVRSFLLGNAVVPDCARYAFFHLLSPHSFILPGQQGKILINRKRIRWPDSGLVDGDGVVWATNRPVPRAMRGPLPIVLDAKLYKAPKSYKAKNVLEPQRKRIALDYWATPRAHLTSASQVMTSRTSHDLPTQIRNEERTPARERKCSVHPNFIEHLMGYVKDYTKAASKN